MRLLQCGFAVLAAIGILTGVSLNPAWAQQPTTDSINYVPEPMSITPRGWGYANITYLPTDPPRALLQWHFWGLNDNQSYTIVVNGTGAGGARFEGACTFQAQPGGEADCTSRFTGLTSLTSTHVYQGSDPGQVVLRWQ
jgi:hypothetical protein